MRNPFTVIAQDSSGSARTGRIRTPHGDIETPAFLPVASQGTVKALLHEQVETLGAQVILVNAYHLYLRPGLETIAGAGGVHKFISWTRPILSDSGGFQVYSLSPLVKVTAEGVRFSSHLDGARIFLRPEDVVDIQRTLGTDIMMVLDYVLPFPSTKARMKEAVKTTTLWARRSQDHFKENPNRQQLWGISQGSVFWDLRHQSIQDLLEIGFDGYAFGGLGIGEPRAELMETLEKAESLVPRNRPRYLMGMGYVEDIVEAIDRGIDLFDCVLPTRNARNGTLFTSRGKIVIKNQKYARDERPIDEGCGCATCRRFSRAYLRHLYEREEITSAVLNTIHNLYFYLDIFRKIRQAIALDSYREFKRQILNQLKDSEP
jgi:queuine tRNA-ribosyltransferase